jgi:hypothetical protein
MTQDEIIEIAKEVGMDYLQYISPEAFEKVVAFVELIAQHEREACAEIAENWNSNGMPRTGVANEIRARGRA